VTTWKIILLAIVVLRALNAVASIDQVRNPINPIEGALNLIGWAIVASLVTLA
jgi:hypothetical protein